MRFTKIKCNEDGVELNWSVIDANGALTTSTYSNAAKPAPELPAALAAFKEFVIDLVGLPETWRDQIVVTTLSLRRRHAERSDEPEQDRAAHRPRASEAVALGRP
jgi:hypothetical protein